MTEYRAEYNEEDANAFEQQHDRKYHREVLEMVKEANDCQEDDTIMIVMHKSDGTKVMTRHTLMPQKQPTPYRSREDD